MSASVIGHILPVNSASTDAGLTLTQVGGVVVMANLSSHVNDEPPVVTVISQAAFAASAATVIFTVSSVALLAVTLFTVTPVQLKLTELLPTVLPVVAKLVPAPVMITSLVSPGCVNAGSTVTHSAPTQVVTSIVRVVGATHAGLPLSLATISSTRNSFPQHR